jgi:hypothetical protein
MCDRSSVSRGFVKKRSSNAFIEPAIQVTDTNESYRPRRESHSTLRVLAVHLTGVVPWAFDGAM